MHTALHELDMSTVPSQSIHRPRSGSWAATLAAAGVAVVLTAALALGGLTAPAETGEHLAWTGEHAPPPTATGENGDPAEEIMTGENGDPRPLPAEIMTGE